MNQREVNRAVAAATGETVSTIAELGFSIADPDEVAFDPDPDEVHYVDWDALQAERNEESSWRPRYEMAAA